MIPALNSFSDVWFRYMASASLQGSLLAIALLAAAWIFRRRSPAFRHALLMIALVKFAVPPTLSLPVGLFYHIRPIPVSQSASPVRYVAPIIEEVLVAEETSTNS